MKKPKPRPSDSRPSKKKKPSEKTPITKSDVARLFEEMASVLELLDENPFKIRSYQNAARAIESLPGELGEMIDSGELLNVKGIGKSLFSHIEELRNTGRLEIYEKAKAKIPEGLLEMLRIPGMGPKKVKAVYEKLGISDIDQLETAANENRVAALEGFGTKTQVNILYGIQNLRKYSERHLLSKAFTEARGILGEISKHRDVKRSLLAGSLRRIKETIKDIDILVSAAKSEAIMDSFTGLSRVASVVAKGKTKSSVVLKSGINADLRVVSDKEFPFASHYFTGSKEHNTEMRGRAKKMGYKLNEYGLFKDDKLVACDDEKAIFRRLGLDYIPPELREAQGEIEAAEQHVLPNLLSETDLIGLFHVHTTYSDGTASVKEMAKGAEAMGFAYLGIADHSRSAAYAGGLSTADVKKQAKEVKEVNKSLRGFRVFQGIESDILTDGSLDYPTEILELFDFVVVSVHQNFGLSQSEMTKRIIRAIENPYTTMLGHPTGRLLLAREAYKVDLYALIDAAAENDVVIEINSNPHRLDLDWRYLRTAKEKGVKIAICPDSHTVEGMEDYRYGVGIARKGWLTKDDVINCLDATGIDTLFASKRKG
ncbi:MAG: DNA polymerase/3'-5' exonuclease PolX [Candidatus Latescibacterota bacterium]|nr:MAG: DNA polymerase/3'-5' exonuclease PolX [Candidatus Latescibacterota bacterium]